VPLTVAVEPLALKDSPGGNDPVIEAWYGATPPAREQDVE
jgi:hypothetical protein